jgi:protein-S-isoprenylcysteine O-methyltransferase Ste14
MFVITVWVLFIFVFLGICGGRDTVGIGPLDGVAFALFAAGSWMNSWSEYARDVWKQRSENQGHLYTIGLFRLCRHPNYLGDLMSFSGLCLLTGAWVTALVPVLMLLSFVTVNIPQLDAYLHQRYGAEFDDYAAKTRKLIPFVY